MTIQKFSAAALSLSAALVLGVSSATAHDDGTCHTHDGKTCQHQVQPQADAPALAAKLIILPKPGPKLAAPHNRARPRMR